MTASSPAQISKSVAVSVMFKRFFGWALLMLFTGLGTVWLRGLVDPFIPAGDWHALLSGLFVVVVWPTLTWSLRALASPHLIELFQLPWRL
jgi:hypothetical protein